MLRGFSALVIAGSIAGTVAPAQTNNITFGGIKADTSLPVEMTADSLAVDQADGTAIFKGKVIIGQGAMRLTADEVLVEYAKGDASKVEKLIASGHVTLVSGPAAAEAEKAIYSVATGAVELSGNVLLTQGTSAMSGQTMTVDLKTGTGRMDGRVKTVLQPGGN
jgi:lipopolysaccharide export system protein LptA